MASENRALMFRYIWCSRVGFIPYFLTNGHNGIVLYLKGKGRNGVEQKNMVDSSQSLKKNPK